MRGVYVARPAADPAHSDPQLTRDLPTATQEVDDDAPTHILRPHSTALPPHPASSSGASYVLELAGTPSRDTVAAALSDGSCMLFASRGPALEATGECVGHKGPVTGLLICPDAPDLLLSASGDGTVRAWDLRSRQQIQQCVHAQCLPRQRVFPGQTSASAVLGMQACMLAHVYIHTDIGCGSPIGCRPVMLIGVRSSKSV